MKNKKKLKKIKEELNAWENRHITGTGTLVAIRDIVDGVLGSQQVEEEFEPGDKVAIDDHVVDYEFRVDALEGHGGLKGQIKVSTWVEPQDIEKI